MNYIFLNVQVSTVYHGEAYVTCVGIVLGEQMKPSATDLKNTLPVQVNSCVAITDICNGITDCPNYDDEMFCLPIHGHHPT